MDCRTRLIPASCLAAAPGWQQEPPPSCCPPGYESHIIGGRGRLDVGGGQIGIVAKIELCGSVFDLADEPDRIMLETESVQSETAYEKVAAEAAREGLDHVRFLLRLAELELIDRERRMVERRVDAAHFSAVKSFDTFDFTAIPSLNKPLVLVSIALPRSVRESDCSISSC